MRNVDLNLLLLVTSRCLLLPSVRRNPEHRMLGVEEQVCFRSPAVHAMLCLGDRVIRMRLHLVTLWSKLRTGEV